MKILVIHNRYLERGGEDEAVEAEINLLKEHGHQVIFYEQSNEDIKRRSFFKKLLFILFELNFSKSVYRQVKEIIKKEGPDIAHIHNSFFRITLAIYSVLNAARVPIVQSLHNYRLVCLKGSFFNRGIICEKCKNQNFINAIAQRCWNNSLFLSFLFSRLLIKWSNSTQNVDAYIVTSEFSKAKFIECGLKEKKIYLKKNFLMIEPDENKQDGRYALFVGRLVDYKGIETLIEAHIRNPVFNLKIIGDGPLREKVRDFSCACKNVEWLGRVKKDVLFEAVKKSSFLVFPSECYENMPITIIESFAFSKPVLASNLGAIKEFVIDGVNGILFQPHNAVDLAEKIAYLSTHNEERVQMGKNANKYFREQFNKEKNYSDLMNIYRETINIKNDSA